MEWLFGKQFPLPTSIPAFMQMKAFLINCDKIICHARFDYKTMIRWLTRNNFEDIFQSKIQLDSQDFFKYVMEQHRTEGSQLKLNPVEAELTKSNEGDNFLSA